MRPESVPGVCRQNSSPAPNNRKSFSYTKKRMNGMEQTSQSGRPAVFLQTKGITKAFAGVKAVDDVDLSIECGKVLGLVGANGAGKSTLIKILAGAHPQDSGSIFIDGREVSIPDPRASTDLGLSFIHQELTLVSEFNAVENITLGVKKKSFMGMIDWKDTRERVQKVIERINLHAPLNVPVKELSIADQWLISIGRALFLNARMIAMDEPTASLSETEVEMLFTVIRDLTANGIAVVYVSHRLDEILEICDSITIMKDGKKVLDTGGDMSKQDLIDVIAGRHVTAIAGRVRSFEHVLLELDAVSDNNKVKDVSLSLYKGEILGISGLAGAGRTELGNLIFGSRRLKSGSMRWEGNPYRPRTPSYAVSKGIVLVPEDRHTEGLIVDNTIAFNVNLPGVRLTRSLSLVPVVSTGKGRSIARSVVKRLQIKTTGEAAEVSSLSGGNQQKVVIGKWLPGNPRLIIMDEPTRGVDVGARAEIYDIIHSMSGNGTTFVVISSDVEELPGLCDRVLVMVEGRVSGELSGKSITKENILKLSYTRQTPNSGGNKDLPK